MERKKVNVRELMEHFNLVQLTGDRDSLNRKVVIPNVSRPGLELAGFLDHAEPKRVVLIGNKETAYLSSLSDEELETRFDFIFSDETPLAIVSRDIKPHPKLLEVAKRKNFPVFSTQLTTSEIMVDIVTYLDEVLAITTSVHGVLMNVFGNGVLIIGESGMGKSEVALELILMGHSLIADDRVIVSRVKETLVGTAPKLIQGMLEIRGIGIIDVTQMFGVRSFIEKEDIDFVIEFEKWEDGKEYLRAGIEDQRFFETLGISIPHLVFPVKEGRNLAVLVESGVRDFMLKKRGIHASKEFDKRVMEHIQAKNKEQNDD